MKLGGIILVSVTILVGCGKSQTQMTKSIANTENAPLVRTDFSDDKAWQAICAELRKVDPQLREGLEMMMALNPGMQKNMEQSAWPLSVELVDDREYAGKTTEQLLGLLSQDTNHSCLYVVDGTTISNPEHPVLVVDLRERGRSFRAIPSEIRAIDDNLSIANMGWEEYADHVQPDGVFRGFPKP